MGVPSLRFDSTETIETYRDYPSIALSHLVSVNFCTGSFLVHVGGEASTQTRFARAAHPGFGLCSLPRSSHSYSCSSSQQSSRSGSAFSAFAFSLLWLALPRRRSLKRRSCCWHAFDRHCPIRHPEAICVRGGKAYLLCTSAVSSSKKHWVVLRQVGLWSQWRTSACGEDNCINTRPVTDADGMYVHNFL